MSGRMSSLSNPCLESNQNVKRKKKLGEKKKTTSTQTRALTLSATGSKISFQWNEKEKRWRGAGGGGRGGGPAPYDGMQMRTAYQEDTKKEKEDDEDREKEEDRGGFPFPLHQFGVFFLFFFSSIPSEAIIYVDAVSLAASPFPFFSARFSLENFCFKERGNKMSITIRERTICYLFPLHSAFLCASWSALLRLVLRHAASRCDFILELSFFF